MVPESRRAGTCQCSSHALGVMYKRGEGVPENDFEAVKWFRKAAEQGLCHCSSQPRRNMLCQWRGSARGLCYGLCLGESFRRPGHRRKPMSLKDLLRPKMTAEQVAEAQKLSGELLRQIESLKSQGQ